MLTNLLSRLTPTRSSLILLLLATLSFLAYLWNNDVIRTLLHELPELFRRFRVG